MDLIKKRPVIFFAFVLFLTAMAIRYQMRNWHNLDLVLLGNWYTFLFERGWRGLADSNFSNYPPAYLYLLWFSTLFSKWLDPLISIKLLPAFFDLISMAFVFLIARLRYRGDEPYLLAAAFFALPTVMVNSSAWGQVDSLYASFLLGCVYFLLVKKPFWALVFFGISFSFKAQAIFLLPFLGIMFLKGKIAWHHFFMIPAVYVLLGLPAALIGRSWESIITLYVGQVGQFEELSRNAPNLYIFISNEYYRPVLMGGLLIFTGSMMFWAWSAWRSKAPWTNNRILFTAFISLALVPFLLPKMHDRYFYPADVFSFVIAIFNPEMWLLPILYQLISGLAYTIFLFQQPVYYVMIAALINTVAVVYVLRKYAVLNHGENNDDQ